MHKVRASLSLPLWVWLCMIAWLCTITVSIGQENKNYKGLRRFLGEEDKAATAAVKGRNVPLFPNVNKIPYFSDPERLKKIQQLQRKGNARRLLPVMEEYVLSFGVNNFRRNASMLWRLGQLYQKAGRTDRALAMFRLAFKHTPSRIDSIKNTYDTLNSDRADLFVPLKYYYELVDFRRSVDTLKPPRSVLTPLGAEVNSTFEDYGPAINRKEDTLFFTTRREKKRGTRMSLEPQLNEDIYYSWGQDGYWEDAQPVKELNTDDNEGSPSLSPNGKELYFSRCHSKGGYGNCDIFVSLRQANGTWGPARNLGAGINGRAWDSQPSLTHSGDTLFFASDRLGGFGGVDLYMSRRVRGVWQRAENMGPTINTLGNEVSPCYHPAYRVLYFSSDRHLVNFGKYDIYKSYYREGGWQEPYNIGPLVNGTGSEYYFTIDYASRQLYYARADSASPQNLELYSFPLPMEGQPLATTELGGTLIDSAGQPLEGIVSVIDLDNGIEIAPKELRKDGSFNFDLIKNNNYLLILQGDDFFRVEQLLRLNGDTSIKTVARRISSQKISFASVDFEHDSYEILESMRADLDNVLNFLVDHPTYRIRISGHTDLTGDSLDNLNLSRQRAEAIKIYLSQTGAIRAERIEARGFGSQQPIVPEERTETIRRTNRRVEFEILYPAKAGK